MEFTFTPSSSKNEREQGSHESVIIIGSGPAGLAAALYAARAELHPLVLAGMQPGGQAATTSVIENYPGFVDGIAGSEMGDVFQKHAEKFGARILMEDVLEVDFSRQPFMVSTYGTTYTADSVILSTGASPVKLNAPGERDLTGRGVSYCATCDGWFFKDKDVAVVGGGDSALEEGLFLTRYARSVTVIHRRDTLRAGAILQKRARENPKVRFIWNSVVERINGEKAVQSLTLRNVKTGGETEHPFDGVFVFIGHHPNSQLFKGQVELDEHGYVRVDERMQTSVAGVFAAGEIADPHFKQVITSAGMGAAAAISAGRFLEAKG